MLRLRSAHAPSVVSSNRCWVLHWQGLFCGMANCTDPELASIVHRVADRSMLTPLPMQRGVQSHVESPVSITSRRMTAPSLVSRRKVNLDGVPVFASDQRDERQISP